jgi:DNA-binding transcriptional LysR family regulator
LQEEAFQQKISTGHLPNFTLAQSASAAKLGYEWCWPFCRRTAGGKQIGQHGQGEDMESSGYMGRLPRMSRLRMFESAARHRSFTKAGAELGVTQAAVSQQVRALEAELGVGLFERQHRGLTLTQEGHRLLRSIATAFDQIADTVEQIREPNQSSSVSVGVTFSVGTFWMLPRLADFQNSFPDIDINLIATDEGFDRIADEAEVGLAYGDGVWPGYEATLVRTSSVFPVCSPRYQQEHPEIDSPDALLQAMLLSTEDGRYGRFNWPQWFSELGLDASRMKPSTRFSSYSLVVQAACDGQGVALGWSLLADDMLADGRLVRPMATTVTAPKSFYLLRRPSRSGPATQLFIEWISAQLGVDAVLKD